MSQRYVVGNWKMNCGLEASRVLATAIARSSASVRHTAVWLAPNFTALSKVLEVTSGTKLRVGAQNAHWEKSGAYTGEVSAEMLKEIGVNFVIVGHSERRQHFGETLETAAKRAKAVLQAGLQCIFCFGESLAEREAGKMKQVWEEQLVPLFAIAKEIDQTKLILAYEPVWAIGTGKVASAAEIKQAHQQISELCQHSLSPQPPILYGGSVSPENFAEIIAIPLVAGGLVGGASLSAEKFNKLIEISESSSASR